MSLFVQIPRNESTIRRIGPYRRRLNVLKGAGTHVQRRMGRGGLGAYEAPLQATLLALAELNRRRLVFYDVGAHVGLFSALLSAVFRGVGIQALAFEPTPSTFARAVKLRDKNQLGYMLFPYAVSDKPGETQLFLSPTAETSNSLNSDFRPGSTAVTVRCETIDHMVEQGAPAPSVMKIDVETFEPQVLRGAMRTIVDHKPWITCEFLGDADDGGLAAALRALEDLGYAFHRITETTPWPALDSADVLANRSNDKGMRDWLAAPKGLPDGFFNQFSAWLAAIGECGAAANIEAPSREERRKLVGETWNPPLLAPERA